MKKDVTIEHHDHQECHAYSAFYLSPFINEKNVLVFTLDEQGDEAFSKAFLVNNREFHEVGKSPVFKKRIAGRYHSASIGSLYSNFTEALGFIRSSDEGKVEALAAFGQVAEPVIADLERAVTIQDNEFFINENIYWKYADATYLESLRHQYDDKDLACTIQSFLEQIVTRYLKTLQAKYGTSHLCIAGGVTANVIMNLKIFEVCNFKNIYVCPPMGDEGSALGAAIKSAVDHGYDCDWVSKNTMPYFGPSFTSNETNLALQKRHDDVSFEFIGANWPSVAGELVAQNNIIGSFNGRMEFGPRALGNRSIIANPLDPNARDRINNEIKRRHKFQPFCPSVLESERETLFQTSFAHKHMAIAFRIKEKYREKLDSAIHVDGTARPQFVEKQDNPDFFKLISTVKNKTGFGIVLNTSFNLHGRPVVFNADHAIDDFLDCGLDYLFINGYKVTRK
jgi:carbamoyltransferase